MSDTLVWPKRTTLYSYDPKSNETETCAYVLASEYDSLAAQLDERRCYLNEARGLLSQIAVTLDRVNYHESASAVRAWLEETAATDQETGRTADSASGS